jgi:hypothetical protein
MYYNHFNNDFQLVVSSDSFVSCTLPRPPKPVRSVLTVQEKLTQESQDVSSLPPQVSFILFIKVKAFNPFVFLFGSFAYKF